MSHDHDICDECGRPVEPARHGGQRRKGKDGRRRCVACQARRIARERPVREPRDACDDCGTAIGTARERRHMCGDDLQRCDPCYLEYRRAKQRKTPPPDRQPGQNPPCGECGKPMADGWAHRIGRDVSIAARRADTSARWSPTGRDAGQPTAANAPGRRRRGPQAQRRPQEMGSSKESFGG